MLEAEPLARPSARSPLYLGIDTGGTYTDAVLYREGSGIVAKAKALTTRHDLAVGITEAARNVIAAAAADTGSIGLVSMSTTLATNALVEGQGGRVALILIGFESRDLERDRLSSALGGDPVIFCPGGHDVHGNPASLDLAPLERALREGLSEQVSAFAVAAYFAVRNPAHEHAARDLIGRFTDISVTCSHELSSRLGGPRRALTTLLNARLVPMITRLIRSTEDFMAAHEIRAPLMVVRGDGALITGELARERPIETILSGPAASLVGALQLTGLENALVADIGGTTTDIAVLEGGKPRLDPDGATIGGFRTMVEAVAMRTYGLGGDSEVALEEGALEPVFRLGPRRVVPLALAGSMHPQTVRGALERQLDTGNPGRHDGRLVMRSRVPSALTAGLGPAEQRLFATIGEIPVAVDEILRTASQNAVLSSLVRRGLVQIIAFTPSDAAHVLGRQANWDRDTAVLGARLLARRRTARGVPVAASPEALSERILRQLTRRSAEAILETAMIEDGLDGVELIASPLLRRALDGTDGIVRNAIALDRPVIGLGASAPLHYSGLERLVGATCIVPSDSDVANALGAVAGQVRASAEAIVSQPTAGVFRAAVGDGLRDFGSKDEALEFAEAQACVLAGDRARAAGTDSAVVRIERDVKSAHIDGEQMFIEARVVATATGRPRIAVHVPQK